MTGPTATVRPPQPAGLDVAMIGNCAISALINREASIVWCCMPRFDGDPVFHAMLDSKDGLPHDGSFGIELEGLVRTEQSYDAGTAILRTRLFNEKGEGLEIVDFAPRFFTRDRPFRPAQIVRRGRPIVGHPRVRFIIRPRGD